MSTLYTMPGITGPQDRHPEAKPCYDGEGRDLGFRTLDEARTLGRASYDEESDTITVLSRAEPIERRGDPLGEEEAEYQQPEDEGIGRCERDEQE